MIYSVTFNPSLDYIMNVENFKQGSVNRSDSEEIYAGGKGINVSIVLKNLGVENKALGFVAGFTGKEIEETVKKYGCSADFIELKEGLSRINVKLKGKIESEINGGGPDIDEESLNVLFDKLNEIQDGDILVLAGSIPKSLPKDIYEKIMAKLNHKDIKVVVDATQDLLMNVLKYKPFFIKPNNHELGEIFNRELKNDDEIIECAKKLQEMGAQNVLISMAGDGAILVACDGNVYKSEVPKGKLINSVGAGDSMVAGFITGYLKNNDLHEALKMGVATGSASAFSEYLATEDKVLDLLKQL